MRWRQATANDRQLALLWSAAALAAIALRPLWLAVAPYLPPCPLRTLTSLPCPTCGSTRAALALLQADLLVALRANPLATIAGLAFLMGGVAAPAWVVLRGKVPELPLPWPRSGRWAVLAALLLNWVWLVVTLP